MENCSVIASDVLWLYYYYDHGKIINIMEIGIKFLRNFSGHP